MTIGAQQHEVFNLRVVALLRAIDGICKMRPAFARNFQAHGERLARSSTPPRLFLRQIAERVASLVVSFGSLRARTLGDALLDGRVRALLFRREVAVGFAFLK